MGDLASLLTAIAGLASALGGLLVVIMQLLKQRHELEEARRRANEED